MKNKIITFDTTLRDGDQAPGFTFSREQKIAFARQLVKLGVDVIEAGFPASSEGDFDSVKNIAKEVGGKDIEICAMARAENGDIEKAAKAVEPAQNPRIHTFLGTSDIHINYKFGKTREWVLEKAVEGVRKAKSYVNSVEFSCEDFSRSDMDFVSKVVIEVVKAGATVINLPDTVGCFDTRKHSENTKYPCYESVKYVIDEVRKRGFDTVFSVHNHNDRGLAVANTIEGIYAGARQIEVTVNGIGERAGNTALEEMVESIRNMPEFYHNVNPKLIRKTSEMCSRFTGVRPQPNKAIVGKNAYSHESGIHQNGMAKNPENYQHVPPEIYGYRSKQTFGPRSGSTALMIRYSQLGYRFSSVMAEIIFKEFKRLADTKKKITDKDLLEIVMRFRPIDGL
jgi:2-isopropylmalate synthase